MENKKKKISPLKTVLLIVVMIAVVFVTVRIVQVCIAQHEENVRLAQEAQAAAELAAAEAAMKEDMLHLLTDRVDPASITGDKAVAVVYEESIKNISTFSTRYVPEEYRTTDASQVRYLIRLVKDKDMAGVYSNGGGVAWRYHFKLTLIDLKEEAILDYEDMFGGEPPAYVSSEDGFSHAGSEPELDRIYGWVREKIQLGYTEESEKLWITIHAQVPASWGEVYCKATEYGDWGVFGENGKKNGIEYKKMEKDGDWYVVDVPNWVVSLWFSTNPELPDVKISEEEKHYSDNDTWLVVSETDGRIREDYNAAKANQ